MLIHVLFSYQRLQHSAVNKHKIYLRPTEIEDTDFVNALLRAERNINMKRFFCCACALLIALSLLPTAAFADDVEILGSPETQTGYLLPDNLMLDDTHDCLSVNSPYKYLFTLTAAKVADLLTTYGTSKTVYRSSLTYAGIYISGRFDITGNGSPASGVKVGLCYYDSFHTVFVSESGCYCIFTLGEDDYGYISRSSLESGTTYYAFVRNSTTGVVNGGYIAGSATYTEMD